MEDFVMEEKTNDELIWENMKSEVMGEKSNEEFIWENIKQKYLQREYQKEWKRNNKMRNYQTCMSDEIHNLFKQKCKKEGKPIAGVISRLIMNYIAEE
jgi:hypothetical protein